MNVYVSSEYGKTKRSGSSFREVLKEMLKAVREEGVDSVEGRDVLYIGDNYISDYLMPRKCGMRSFLYNH